jgi:MSHA biogenesis protein MshQ
VTIFGIGKADSCNVSLQSCTWTYPTIVGTPTTSNAQGSGMTGFSSFAVGRNVRSFTVSNPGTQSQYVPFTVTITARDQSGNPATNFNGTVTISSSGCTISLGGGTSANFVNGTLTPTITLASSGNCTITATLTGSSEAGTSPTFTVNPTSFNAFEIATAANAISGNIQTKVAGVAFNLAIVAISGGAKATGFNGNVKLELLANGAAAGTGYGTDNCPTTNTVIQTVASSAIVSGRSNAAFSAVADVYRDVRVRISYPTASSTTVVCSGDSFAVRPSGFTISVTDADWQTAGTARALGNISASGGNVHKAGQSFTITATASPNTVTLYNGNITLATSGLACTNFGSGCANGTLSLGSWSTGVTRSTTTATYGEAGSFNLTLEDVDFASIDASDGSNYTVTQTTAPVAVGRFVPDHFKFVTPNTPQLQTFGSSCSTRSFTYIGQSFWYVTLPSATVQAVAADGTTVTTNYRGSLFKLTSSGITEAYTPVALDATGIGTAQLTGVGNGTATYSASASGTLKYTRNTGAPASPFSANISLSSVTASDASENAANPGSITTPSALSFSSIGFDAGATFRYGRLRLQNSSGLLNVDLFIPIETQYWTGSAFTTNADDFCTSLSAANLSLGSYIGGITAANVGASHITLGGAFAKGVGNLRLTKPSLAATSPGATTLTVDLSAEAKIYLQGAWTGSNYTDNPSVRATFGVFGSQPKNFIYQRENY